MDMPLDLECPNPKCRKKFKIKLSEAARNKPHKCSSCGTVTEFKKEDFRKVKKSLDGFERTIKNLNKSLKIKF